jgi:hypothetical protein
VHFRAAIREVTWSGHRSPSIPSILGRRFFDVIDHQHSDRAILLHQPEAKLVFDRNQEAGRGGVEWGVR